MTTSTVPRLASDLRRVMIATVGGGVASLVVSTVYTAVKIIRDERPSYLANLTYGLLGVAIVMFATYQILTWLAFAGSDGRALREMARKTNPRTAADRRRNLLLGSGPKSWAITAVGIAMVVVLAVIIDESLRSNLWVVVAALACVALSWVLIAFAFAVGYLRNHAEHPDDLAFPGRGADDPPVWRDYLYLAFQVSATFSSSDVTLTSTRIRGQVTAHTIMAFVFNTVIVALLVSAIVIIPGGAP